MEKDNVLLSFFSFYSASLSLVFTSSFSIETIHCVFIPISRHHSSTGKHNHHHRHGHSSSSSKSSSSSSVPNAMARARLLWSLESLRFNGGGRPPLWLGLGARTGSSSSGSGSLRGNSNTLLRDIQDSSNDGSGGSSSGRSQVNEAVQDWESQAESEEENTAEEENEKEKAEAFDRGAEPPPRAAEGEEDGLQSQEIAQRQATEDVSSFVSPLEQEQETKIVAAPVQYENNIAAAAVPTIVSDSNAIGSSYMMETRTSITTGVSRQPNSIRSNCQVMTYVGEHDNPLPEVKQRHPSCGQDDIGVVYVASFLLNLNEKNVELRSAFTAHKLGLFTPYLY